MKTSTTHPPSEKSPAVKDAPRILFLDQSGQLGGAELYLHDLTQAVRSTSRVVLFEEGPFAQKLRDSQIPVTIIEAPAGLHQVNKHDGLGSALQGIPGLMRLARRVSRLAEDYDVLFANTQKALLVAACAGWMADRPVVWHLHDLLIDDHFTSLNRTAAVQCSNWLTDRVIVNSQATRKAYEEAGGTKDTSLIYYGIDSTPFEEVTSQEIDTTRNQLGLSDGPVLGVFSRLAPWKGQHVLVEALDHLPDAQVLFVGDALFDGDESYIEDLRSRIDELGHADRVHFLGFRDDVPLLMKVCDIVLHTSVAPEPFGRVIAEGMLARRPVVATRAGGAVEIVDDGRTGHLVPPNDPEALATTLSSLLNEPDRAKQLAEAGYRHAKETFSVSKMREEIIEVVSNAYTNNRS